MNDFKGRHHKGEIILWAVRWYCKYGISYRDLETMLAERGVDVDDSTIFRLVQKYAPEIEKRLRWYWRAPSIGRSWRVGQYIGVWSQSGNTLLHIRLEEMQLKRRIGGVAVTHVRPVHPGGGKLIAETLHACIKIVPQSVATSKRGKRCQDGI